MKQTDIQVKKNVKHLYVIDDYTESADANCEVDNLSSNEVDEKIEKLDIQAMVKMIDEKIENLEKEIKSIKTKVYKNAVTNL